MLSIIICSRTQTISRELSDNIKNTAGCSYELIIVDNSESVYSIFEAYNLGIQKSKGTYWCFIHDDILFHTNGWGNSIISIFQSNDEIGLIGTAGTKIKTKMPSAWWDCPDEFTVINMTQHLNSGEIEKWNVGWSNSNLEEVVAIDGVFMVARNVENFKFSTSLKGFHNYDLNLSFEYIKRNYKIVVTREIMLEHFSLGTINSSWYDSTIKIHNLYSKILPLSVDSQIDYNLKKIEFDNGSRFLNDLIEYTDKITALKLWIRLFALKPKSKFHFKFLKRFLK